MGYQQKIRKIEACYSDYDELSAADWGDDNERHVSIAFIAVLPAIFWAIVIGLIYWVFR